MLARSRFGGAIRRALKPTAAAALAVVALAGARGGQASDRWRVPFQYTPSAGLELYEIIEGDTPLEDLPPDSLPQAPVAAQGDYPAPEGMRVSFRDYPTPEDIEAFLHELEARHPDLVEVFTIGESWQGRPIHGVRLTNEGGPQPIEDRPLAYIDGQHHARELISSQVALYTLWRLAHEYGREPLATHLLDTRVVVFVPSVNPDGNAVALQDYQAMRKTANPEASDDDADGRFDEDPSEGYGYGSHSLRLFTFDQEWADQHPDNPFQGDWTRHLQGQPQDLGRFTGALGGPVEPIAQLDKDGDGARHEDEVGGVDPNRNYDAHWSEGEPDPRSDGYRGPAAWSEPETQAVRDLVAELPTLATALSYHSGTDVILHPWGWSASADLPDAALFENLSRKGTQLTAVNGFPGSPHTWTARGLYRASGSTMDYLYDHHGAMAWSPEVYGSSGISLIERVGATGTFTLGQSTGIGFNPNPPDILATADRWHRFAVYILAATPNISLTDLVWQDGVLTFEVGNDGAIPVEVTPSLVIADAVVPLATRLLQAGTAVWSAPLEAGAATLRLEALLPSPAPHVVERLEVVLSLGPEGVAADPPPEAFVDLGAAFPDGWWAGPEWDEPERHHLGPPIPTSTPTPDGSQTPGTATATASATSTEPVTLTASPTATGDGPVPSNTPTGQPRSPRLFLPAAVVPQRR